MWTYHVEHTQECADRYDMVLTHVSGRDWDYSCNCPTIRKVDLIKPGPPTMVQSIWTNYLIEELARPLPTFSRFNGEG